jgi:SPP1 Gp6-like portal protein
VALSAAQAIETVRKLLDMRSREMQRLDVIQDYLRDDPNRRDIGGLPTGAPADVVRLARLARVNVLKYVVSARVQNMYVDGFRTPTSPDDLDVWNVWQANKMDARQIGVHRAALSFGASYVTALPGERGAEPMPVFRGYSPRQLTAAYGDDDEWPLFALIKMGDGKYRLIDETTVYAVTVEEDKADGEMTVAPREHGVTWQGEPVCPVVRYRETDDLDDPCRGIVEPFFPLQDQVNITTFGLQVAQHYGAFRQRYVIGWLAETEQQALRASASRLLNFEDSDITVGEFQQTELRGYIESREATIRHLATVSQTPVHELLGQFVNLSAEALEAARASHAAGVEENRIVAGESHEQLLNLGAEMIGAEPDANASVVWRDTRVRSLKEAAEALGALVEKLGVPPRELWHLIPGIPQHEVERWTVAASQADSMEQLTQLLDRQAAPSAPPAAAPPAPMPPAPMPMAA